MNRQRASVQSTQRPDTSGSHGSGSYRIAESSSNHAEVHDFFDRFAAALSRGDGAAIAAMWETPALVVADAGAHAVSSAKEIEDFYAVVKHQYNLEGIFATRAEVVRIERPSARLLQVLVRWPYLDREGREQGEESTTYILRRTDAGEPKVRVAIVESPSRGPRKLGTNGAGEPPRRTH